MSRTRPNAKESGSKILGQATNTTTKTRRARCHHIRRSRMHDRGEFQSRRALASAFPTPTTPGISFRLSFRRRLATGRPHTQRISDIIAVWWGVAVVQRAVPGFGELLHADGRASWGGSCSDVGRVGRIGGLTVIGVNEE
jgi:hypothetical protein